MANLTAKLYTNQNLAYSNRNVFKSVTYEPDASIDFKHFNFGDFINSSIILTNKTDVAMRMVTYCVINFEDVDLHYFVTTIEYLSGNKYKLGLIRNVWTDIDSVTEIKGIVNRGVGTGIAHYRSNSIEFSEQKNSEYYIVDDYGKDSAWGILFTSQVESNPSISLNSSQYTIVGTNQNETDYWTKIRYNNYCKMISTNDICIYAKQSIGWVCLRYSGTSMIYGGHSSDHSGGGYLYIDLVSVNEVEETFCFTESSLYDYIDVNNSIAIYYNPLKDIKYDDSDTNQTNIRNYMSSYFGLYRSVGAVVSDSSKVNNDNIYNLMNPSNYTGMITANNVDYTYITSDALTTNNGSTIAVTDSSTGEKTYYKTNIEYSTVDYTETSSYIWSVSTVDYINTGTHNMSFPTNFQFTYSSPIYQAKTLTTANYYYDEISDIGEVVLSQAAINTSVVLSEPYGIIAIPLFDCTDTDGNSYSKLNNQEFFYNMISQYSGGDYPYVVDAQVIPYAPNDFIIAYTDGRIDLSKLTSAVSSSTDYNGFPPCMILTSSDITINQSFNLSPYSDIQKEYTLNKYRIKAPSQASAFDFKYYDYSVDSSSITMQVNVTLKPFGSYLHCSPLIQQGAIAGAYDFEDIRGVISDYGIFECTMTSDAFETYARENSMYEDIQERTIDTLTISQNAERVNEISSGIVGTLQSTAVGAIAGGSTAGTVGAVVGGAAAGITSAAAYATQYAANETLRNRELSDSQYYYEANLKTLQALPNTINRVSSFNQDVLRKFCFFIEKYSCPSDEITIYDEFVSQCGDSLNLPCDIKTYLNNGNYIQANVFKTNARAEIANQIKNDLEKGVYYYESI